jgi:cyclophilin family peptidyl-prolyl cis-trans isomerase
MIVSRRLRTVLVCGVLMAVLPAGFARAAKDANDFKTDQDKVSYIIGTQIVNNFKQQGIEVNVDMLFRGIREAMAGLDSPFTQDEQNKLLMDLQKRMIEKLQAQQQQQQAQAMEKLGKENEWKLKLTKPELMKFDPTKDYFWVLETNKGNIKIKFMPDVAPMHVTSTIFLTGKGFYDGTMFHRVIPGFMAQGGDPLGTGSGGPGYLYDSEFSPKVKYDRPFLLGMANTGKPTSDGSQFFITFMATPGLDGKHSIFGEVVEGQDTVKKLEAAGSQQGKTKEELKIVKARIEEKAKETVGGTTTSAPAARPAQGERSSAPSEGIPMALSGVVVKTSTAIGMVGKEVEGRKAVILDLKFENKTKEKQVLSWAKEVPQLRPSQGVSVPSRAFLIPNWLPMAGGVGEYATKIGLTKKEVDDTFKVLEDVFCGWVRLKDPKSESGDHVAVPVAKLAIHIPPGKSVIAKMLFLVPNDLLKATLIVPGCQPQELVVDLSLG